MTIGFLPAVGFRGGTALATRLAGNNIHEGMSNEH